MKKTLILCLMFTLVIIFPSCIPVPQVEITFVGRLNTSGSAEGIYVSGNYAYVADGESGLQIIDISNPSTPKFIGHCDTPNCANNIYLSGDYAYIADGESGLQIIDISNVFAPILVGKYDTPDCAYDVFVSGNYAYVG